MWLAIICGVNVTFIIFNSCKRKRLGNSFARKLSQAVPMEVVHSSLNLLPKVQHILKVPDTILHTLWNCEKIRQVWRNEFHRLHNSGQPLTSVVELVDFIQVFRCACTYANVFVGVFCVWVCQAHHIFEESPLWRFSDLQIQDG
ncbi:hypothetical protein SO802_024849 [Lithocarpus litseifolius]|uniref:Uncharacterized protein n=1 Tax=Lithocarpus litseifolius TaxID=425828 RepID=A0AAW2CA11_9ROSI